MPIDHPLMKQYWEMVASSHMDTTKLLNMTNLLNMTEGFIDICYRCPECGFSLLYCTDDLIQKVKAIGSNILNDEIHEILASTILTEGMKSWLCAAIIAEEVGEYAEAGTMLRKVADYCEFTGFDLNYKKTVLFRAYKTYFKALAALPALRSEELPKAWCCGYLAVDCMRRIGDFIGGENTFDVAKRDFDNVNQAITFSEDGYGAHIRAMYKMISESDSEWHPILPL